MGHEGFVPLTARSAAVEVIGHMRRGAGLDLGVNLSRILKDLSKSRRELALTVIRYYAEHKDDIDAVVGSHFVDSTHWPTDQLGDIVTAAAAELYAGASESPKLTVSSYIAQAKDRGLERYTGLLHSIIRTISEGIPVPPRAATR